MLTLDCFEIIISFLDHKEVVNLFFVSKEFYENCNLPSVWKIIGKRDCPILEIKNKKDYISKNPFIVTKAEIQYELKKFNNLQILYNIQRLNSNGLEDHLYKEHVKSILRCVISEKKLRKIKVQNLDWRISITKAIEQLQDESHNLLQELTEHHNFKNI